MEPRKDLTTLGLERMLLTEDLIISCRTTCGCGNKLVPYTKQTETTHYLLTCKPFSDKYDHPLLIAIDKNSPIFKKAEKWELILDEYSDMATRYGRLAPYELDFFELFLERIVKGVCHDCGETKPCPKHHREGIFYHDSTKYLEEYRSEKSKLEQENKQLKEKNGRLIWGRECSSTLREENANLKQKLEKMGKELQRRIDEETKHINHPKQIYKSVEHNCKYNLRVCEILKEILDSQEKV